MSNSAGSSPPLLTVAIAASANHDMAALREDLSDAGLLHQADVQICIAFAGQVSEVDDSDLMLMPCASGTPVFRLYAHVIDNTTSEYVALLDAACPPCRAWLTAAREQIANAADIFYGPVNSGWGSDDPRNTGYLIEYAQFRRPLQPGLPEYPGNNLVFRRTLLTAVPGASECGFQKTFFLRCIEERLGIKPRACDKMLVTYRKSYPWRYYLCRRLRHGRLYGSSHARSLGMRRFLHAGGTLLLPLIRYWRILRMAAREPGLRADVLRFSGRVILSEIAWSIGECQGYLAGAAPDEAFLD